MGVVKQPQVELVFNQKTRTFDVADVKKKKGGNKVSKKVTEEKKDMVNAPKHYCPNGVDSFMAYKDIVGPEPFRGFLQLNVMKYIQRYMRKEAPAQDLNKAFFFLAHLFFEMGGREGSPGEDPQARGWALWAVILKGGGCRISARQNAMFSGPSLCGLDSRTAGLEKFLRSY